MIDAIAALANRFWRIHPKEIQDLGITREQFYEREMRLVATQATARIEQLEARLDRAVTRGLEQVERIATLEAALGRIARGGEAVLLSAELDECPVNPKVLEQIVKEAHAALAGSQDK